MTTTIRTLTAAAFVASLLMAGPATAQIFKPVGCKTKVKRPGKRQACITC